VLTTVLETMLEPQKLRTESAQFVIAF